MHCFSIMVLNLDPFVVAIFKVFEFEVQGQHRVAIREQWVKFYDFKAVNGRFARRGVTGSVRGAGIGECTVYINAICSGQGSANEYV
ncbi:hypothetical protein DPMN_153922 [Dreissena polymorpha]|uniref:Uncharacterized protein n=1 Tax=Dreissena polymorpha TaxID=45954 RepID=A0A9D4FJG4_DREPO|nr:hypothetical protein DPMN_153922 [Dreissena polymorpha]